jgi:RNA polymerase sigma-70 factor, ECF subfamily
MSEEAQAEVSPGGTAQAERPRSDADILAAATRGAREEAAGLLVAVHAPALGRTCMALLGSQEEAEDALRETLRDALDGLAARRGDVSLRAWLSSIARKLCARRLAARTQPRGVDSLESPKSSVPTESVTQAQRARRLLAEVKPTEREALVLRFGAELTFREVAEACGVDEITARKRVSRGLSRLHSSLGEDDR